MKTLTALKFLNLFAALYIQHTTALTSSSYDLSSISRAAAVSSKMKMAKTEGDDETWIEETKDGGRRDLIINAVGLGLLGASGVASASLFKTNVYTPSGKIQNLYIYPAAAYDLHNDPHLYFRFSTDLPHSIYGRSW
jgi:hypothetical protein